LKFVDLTSWGMTTTSNDTSALASCPSLTFLEQVIISLQGHRRRPTETIPWRSCTLTHVLKGSFKRGNTVLLATIFGDKQHLQASLTTLRFASRLNNVTVEPAHVEISDAESRVSFLEEELEKLKAELKMKYTLSRIDDRSPQCASYEPLTVTDIDQSRRLVQDFLSFKSNHLDVLSLRHVNKLFELMREEYIHQGDQLEADLRAKYTLTAFERPGSNSKGQSGGKKGVDDKKDSDKKSTKDKKGGADKKSTNKKIAADSSRTSLTNTDSTSHLRPSHDNSRSQLDTTSNQKLEHPTNEQSPATEPTETFNIFEAFEDFKKNSGRGSYMNILSSKKLLVKNTHEVSLLAVKINKLVEEIDECDKIVKEFSNSHPETEIITEEECAARQEAASKKGCYISMKEKYSELQLAQMQIHRDLEKHRKQLMLEFSEEHSNHDIFGLANLQLFGNTKEQTQPPFTIPKQKEQNDPSFTAWQGARLELARTELGAVSRLANTVLQRDHFK